MTVYPTRNSGNAKIELEPNSEYEIVAFQNGIQSNTQKISTIGKGHNDLLAFSLDLGSGNTTPRFAAEGKVVDKNTNKSIAKASVKIIRVPAKPGEHPLYVITDLDGNYHFDLLPETTYELVANKDNRFSNIMGVSTKDKKAGETFYSNLFLGANNDKIVYVLNGVVINKVTQKPIKNSLIKLHKQNDTIADKEAVSDALGRFSFYLYANSDYELIGSSDDMETATATISTIGKTQSERLDAKLYLGFREQDVKLKLKGVLVNQTTQKHFEFNHCANLSSF